MRTIITIVFNFLILSSIGQNFIGKWTYQNQAKKEVIIEFDSNSEYRISIDSQTYKSVESSDKLLKKTKLTYKITGKRKPYKIDIISDYSNVTVRGIIQLINDNTIQLQINPNSCGERPEKFDKNSIDYVEATRID
ncbi:MAG: hypothetical protein K0M50_03005 [Prolixibacteraceae bacterium]|nr:hypothetical protein [Prolixibacteraceae bacterium]